MTGANAVVAEDGRTIASLSRANTAERPQPPASPLSHNQVGFRRMDTRDRLTPCSHQREQDLHSVDPVPEQIRMVWFRGRGTIRIAAQNFTHLGIVSQRPNIRIEAEARGAEPRHSSLLGQARELPRISQTGSEWLVNEHTLLRGQDGLHLLEVDSAVHALQKDRVDLGTEGRDRRHNFHLQLVSQLRRKALNPARARFNIRASSLVRSYDARARHVIRGGRVVQDLCEFDYVRRIEPDNPHTQRLLGFRPRGPDWRN